MLRESFDPTWPAPKPQVRELLLKSFSSQADDDDMEPLDPRPRGALLPPPVGSGALAAAESGSPVVAGASAAPPAASDDVTTQLPTTSPAASSMSSGPAWAMVPPSPSSRQDVVKIEFRRRPMAPWRIAGALALVAVFASIGWQVQGLIDGRAWSNALMWATIAAGVVVALCVLAWTWAATENARRLVGPAARADLPDPKAALRTWIIPFAFIAVAVAVVTAVGASTTPVGDQTVSALPLAVAVIALLLAIPMTYRPMNYLAGVVRQVGGYTVRVSQWMWVPLVMGLVGVASIVALRYAGIDDSADTGLTDVAGWAPLWMVAVVAIAPCVVVLLLAWRAASSVEDAIAVASSRRRPGSPKPPASPASKPGDARKRAQSHPAKNELGGRIDLLPGADLLRLTTVTLLAGAALLSMVGAAVTGMLWLDSRDTGVLPAERQRAWDALDALETASRGITIAMLVAVSAWSFVAVLNVRMTSGRRRNPLIAALAWPAAAAAVWWIGDRVMVDASIGQVVLGFVAQAAALAVPFLVLERSADAIGARRTPLRIVYALGVVLLIHVQGLGGLSRLPESISTTEIGRLTGYLAIGALIQLCSTLAITDACRAMSRACRHEADHHNMLVEQQETRARGREATAGR